MNRLSLLTASLALASLGTTISIQAQAQVSGDGTVGTLVNFSSMAPCTTFCLITGGTQPAGTNVLFHSFDEFSLGMGNVAFFNNLATIENIIVRVTGGPSDIHGLIRSTVGNANLFFLNPSGITFSSTAQLDVSSSFIATTASAFEFTDGTLFSATNPGSAPSLTVNLPPSNLVFTGAAGPIVNRSQVMPGFQNSIGTAVGLAVQPGQTLALMGGDVTLDGGNITAGNSTVGGGRVELGSVRGSGNVGLSAVSNGFTLDYSNIQTPNAAGQLFGNVELNQEAVVDTSGFDAGGGGAVQVRGEQVVLNNAAITSSTFDQPGGGIQVTASSVELQGTLPGAGDRPAGFFSQARDVGAAGDITVNTENLTVKDGAFISASTIGDGQGGAIDINASKSVSLSSSNGSFSGISSSTFAGGQAGNVDIDTPQLTIQDGTQIFASTGGSGDAGRVIIQNAKQVEIIGEGSNPSGIFTQVNSPGTGKGGLIDINSRRLVVRDGGQVSASTFTSGMGGSVDIDVSDSVEISGSGTLASGIFAVTEGSGAGGNIVIKTQSLRAENGGQVSASTTASGQGGTITVSKANSVTLKGASGAFISGLFATTESSAQGGDVNVMTNSLKIEDGATLSVSGSSTGDAGTVKVTAPLIQLHNGTITAETASGAGGNIELNSKHIKMRDRSIISTTAGTSFAPGNGGNIEINTGLIVGLENSDITSNSFLGQGGRIVVNAEEGIFGLQFRPQLTSLNDITAISLFNPELNGEVALRTPDIDPTQGLNEQEEIEKQEEIEEGCEVGGSNAGSLRRRGTDALPGSSLSRGNGEIVEAQGWVWDENNPEMVILTANASGVVPYSIPRKSETCKHK